jgi:uncharacterized protein DUF4388/type III secretion system (T3SS) inner membrane Yop/YscD-like protein
MSFLALQGNLDAFKLPDVLTFLNSTRKTGMLTLTLDEKEAYVFFRAGAVVYAASNLESLRLGPILVRKKRLSREQASEIDDLMLRSGGHFGDIALQKGILSPAQLDDFLKIQVSEVIYDAFVWKTGGFSFFDGIDLPKGAVTISIDLSNLIMEGARRINEWEECIRLLPDSSIVFRVTTDPETEKITLTLDEWKILFLINGQRTLEDLCRDTEVDAFRVYRLVYGLLANKLIQPTTSPVDDEDVTAPITVIEDDTMRQSVVDYVPETTVRDLQPDDTSLLVSEEATLSFHDVVKKTVAQLLIMGGEEAGTVVPLVENEYLIGRQHDNQIILRDLGVSAHHARIYRSPDGFVIEDLKSRNGTWLNSTRIFHSILKSGDEIRVGATDLRFETLQEPSSEPAVDARAGVSRPAG